jgi:uncharacterized protein YegP (UPF0339 family)
MATATKKVDLAAVPTRAVRSGRDGTAPAFAVYRDNGGEYHWEIIRGDGQSLAHSTGFASHRDAARAAQHVCGGAGLVMSEPTTTREPVQA